LNKLYKQYKGRAAFFVVYILEAHPIDAWQDEDNQKDKIAVASAKSEADRCAAAATCVTKLSLEIPPLVDDFQNSTEIAYTGWPDRLYVIDRDGKIAYKSRAGPYGFKPAEVEETLQGLIH
jgi:hypothetical protein